MTLLIYEQMGTIFTKKKNSAHTQKYFRIQLQTKVIFGLVRSSFWMKIARKLLITLIYFNKTRLFFVPNGYDLYHQNRSANNKNKKCTVFATERYNCKIKSRINRERRYRQRTTKNVYKMETCCL